MTIPDEVVRQMEFQKANHQQATEQQGLGKSIISVKHQGHRFVGIGSRLYHSEKWHTFHDFLIEYGPNVLGSEWLQREFQKPPNEWHPVAKYRKLAFDYMKGAKDSSLVTNGRMTGATFAYMHLCYNLYLLAHNAKVEAHLLKRLVRHDQFEDAYYETKVAAAFIQAGFKLELEDEDDATSSHCEFTATAPNGQKYSVEAKARRSHKQHYGFDKQLLKALRKKANHPRVIFIEMSMPELLSKRIEMITDLRRLETQLTVNGQTAEPAYVFFTNHSYPYNLNGHDFERTGFAHGFKIPDFSFDFGFSNLTEAIDSRESHRAIVDLISSMNSYTEIPVTFEGENPYFAFDESAEKERLFVGRSYLVPSESGEEEGILENGAVMENERKMMGVFKVASGKRIIVSFPMTDVEVRAYRAHPETFFGVKISVGISPKTPLELYDFFHETYQHTPKELLLDFLRDHVEAKSYEDLPQKALARKYCEELVKSDLRTRVRQRPPPMTPGKGE